MRAAVLFEQGKPQRVEELDLEAPRAHEVLVRMAASGPHVRVTIDCGFPLVALVTQRSADDLRLSPGRPVTAHFKATAPHLLRHCKP